MFGGAAKACGALTLQIQPEPKTTVLATEVAARAVRVTSTAKGRFDCEVSPFAPDRRDKLETADFIAWMDGLNTPAWARQALGCLRVFGQKFAWSPGDGVNLSIASDLPIGLGLGSGVALKVAVVKALAKLSGCYVGPQDIVDVVQKVDTEILGRPAAPDRALTSIYGKPGHLLPIDMRTGEVMTTVALPKGVTLFTWSRKVDDEPHREAFRKTSIAAAMGAAIFARQAPGRIEAGLPTPSVLSRCKDAQIPIELSSEQFQRDVDAKLLTLPLRSDGSAYPVKPAFAFSIHENHRSIEALHLLSSMAHRHKRKTVELVGELLFQSHYELSLHGLSFPLAEEMIDALVDAGPAQGIFGARVSGEGHGCSVVVLAEKKAIAALRQLAREHCPSSEDPMPIL